MQQYNISAIASAKLSNLEKKLATNDMLIISLK